MRGVFVVVCSTLIFKFFIAGSNFYPINWLLFAESIVGHWHFSAKIPISPPVCRNLTIFVLFFQAISEKNGWVGEMRGFWSCSDYR